MLSLQELLSVKWYRLNCVIFSQVIIGVGNLFNKICLHNVQKKPKFRIIVAYRKNGFHTMTYESLQKCLREHLKNVFRSSCRWKMLENTAVDFWL